eukprot:TRINITY_DN14580_c0_g1_i3.p2 TRINITY_DN14580_c0_g1~~TRINITY_DN14580_c0_g1_i3.p2  ORF type:complete len:105 (-),score=24.92 TRINITY_DN14580_c0_g1_i3:57-371(-)
MPENKMLRRGLLGGALKPNEIVQMSSRELAPPERKSEVAKLQQQQLEKDTLAKPDLPVTGMFKCDKCGGRNASYREVQTRSADEPTTVFLTCLVEDCGNSWIIY